MSNYLKVKDLEKILSTADDEAIVILSSDAEGNTMSPMDNMPLHGTAEDIECDPLSIDVYEGPILVLYPQDIL